MVAIQFHSPLTRGNQPEPSYCNAKQWFRAEMLCRDLEYVLAQKMKADRLERWCRMRSEVEP
jgi:hypothetical protein